MELLNFRGFLDYLSELIGSQLFDFICGLRLREKLLRNVILMATNIIKHFKKV